MKVQEWVEKELEKYVTLDRFSPVERIVYGAVGLILTAVLVAIVALVVRK